MEVSYDGEPCTFEINNGNVIVTRPCGSKLVRPLAVFRMEIEQGAAALDAYDHRNAEVVVLADRRSAAAH